jgi:hypothetical protein
MRSLRGSFAGVQERGSSQRSGDEFAAVHGVLFRTMLKNEKTFDNVSRFCETKSEWSPPLTSR